MSIPSYLSENTFRCYEGHIKRAVDNFPTETEFPRQVQCDLHGVQLSGNTFAARFRDSLVSVMRFGWETNIDTAKLRSIAGQYAVGYDASGSVWFRHKGKRGRPSQLVQENRILNEASQLLPQAWENVQTIELAALALLISTSRLHGPYLITGQVDQAVVTQLEEQYGISFVYDANNKTTVIT